MSRRSWAILAAVVLLSVLPFWLAGTPPSDNGTEPAVRFGGADTRAQQAIVSIAPGYRRWSTPLFEPASEEVASLLFALQAALGAGVIGYWLGWSMARERCAAAAPAQAQESDAH